MSDKKRWALLQHDRLMRGTVWNSDQWDKFLRTNPTTGWKEVMRSDDRDELLALAKLMGGPDE
jgi:hypothetical protein